VTPAEAIAKLERQPLHEGSIVLSWQTRDELIDLLRRLLPDQPNAHSPLHTPDDVAHIAAARPDAVP